MLPRRVAQAGVEAGVVVGAVAEDDQALDRLFGRKGVRRSADRHSAAAADRRRRTTPPAAERERVRRATGDLVARGAPAGIQRHAETAYRQAAQQRLEAGQAADGIDAVDPIEDVGDAAVVVEHRTPASASGGRQPRLRPAATAGWRRTMISASGSSRRAAASMAGEARGVGQAAGDRGVAERSGRRPAGGGAGCAAEACGGRAAGRRWSSKGRLATSGSISSRARASRASSSQPPSSSIASRREGPRAS